MDYAVRITLSAASPTPEYTGGFWAAGVASLSAGAPAVGWTSGKLVSCSQVGESVDIAQGGNYAILSDCTVALTAVGWSTAAAAGVSLHNAMVEVGTLSGTTLVPRWVGYVADMDWTGAVLTLTVESLAGRRHREIPARRLTSDELPNLPKESEGVAVPIVWGSVERMTPPKRSSKRQYLGAFLQVIDAVATERESTFVAVAPTTETVRIGLYGNADGSTVIVPPTFWESTEQPIGQPIYLEIVSGTGSGQTRKSANSYHYGTTGKLTWVEVDLESAFSPQPDTTSEIKIFSNPDYLLLAVCDECAGTTISADVDEQEFEIQSFTDDVDGIAVANVSYEFYEDNKYTAVKYLNATDIYGKTSLSDGVTKTGSAFTAICATRLKISSTNSILTSDVVCRASYDVSQIEDADNVSALTFIQSFDVDANALFLNTAVFHAVGVTYSGQKIALVSYRRLTLPTDRDWNAYSQTMAADGDLGNYSIRSVSATLPVPLQSIERIYTGVSFEADYPEIAPELTDQIGAWLADLGIAANDTSFHVQAVTSAGGISYNMAVGMKIRPIAAPGTGADDWNYSRVNYDDADNGVSTLNYYGTVYEDLRTITSVTPYGVDGYNIEVDAGWDQAFTTPIMVAYESWTEFSRTGDEREAGLAVPYGDASTTSTFLASVESGRSLPLGGPIVYADDAALDMLSTDLGLVSADIDSTGIGALNSRPIHAVIGSPEMSSDIYARMCREFNWIAAHDSTGRETAKNWLGSLGAASQDYSVANSDIIEDSIEGPQMTAIEDIISMPTVSRSWTQADGFRQVASVLSFDIDPGDLDEDNYLQYMTGWDSFAQASEAYAILYANRAKYGIEQRGNVEYKYTSDIQTLLIDENLLHWLSARKEILEFSVRDNHAGAFATLGKRFAVTHRRYAPSAKRGTLVARYWNPEKRTVQLTVMIDP